MQNFYKLVFLKLIQNSQESISAGVFFIKVVGLQLLARNFVEKETPAQVNFKNSYFVEHFLAASAFYQAKSWTLIIAPLVVQLNLQRCSTRDIL